MAEQTFEQKLSEVKLIIDELQAGTTSLEELVKRHSRAVGLIDECSKFLTETKKSLETLEINGEAGKEDVSSLEEDVDTDSEEITLF